MKGLTHHPDIAEIMGFLHAPDALDASESLRFVFIFVFAFSIAQQDIRKIMVGNESLGYDQECWIKYPIMDQREIEILKDEDWHDLICHGRCSK